MTTAQKMDAQSFQMSHLTILIHRRTTARAREERMRSIAMARGNNVLMSLIRPELLAPKIRRHQMPRNDATGGVMLTENA